MLQRTCSFNLGIAKVCNLIFGATRWIDKERPIFVIFAEAVAASAILSICEHTHN